MSSKKVRVVRECNSNVLVDATARELAKLQAASGETPEERKARQERQWQATLAARAAAKAAK